MENYVKAVPVVTPTNVEINLALIESIQLEPSVIHMNVKMGSKVSNLINYANKKLKDPDVKQITWNGSGEALNKVVACVEIIKKDFKELYQINKIGFINDEEIWNSKLESLRDIKVTKQIPSMSIILSKIPLDPNELGYQTNKSVDEIFNTAVKPNNNKNKKNRIPVAGDEVYVKKKKNNSEKK